MYCAALAAPDTPPHPAMADFAAEAFAASAGTMIEPATIPTAARPTSLFPLPATACLVDCMKSTQDS
jgi:hypothetical protein